MITTIESIRDTFDKIFNNSIQIKKEDDFRTVLEDELDNITEFIENQSRNISDDFTDKSEIIRIIKTFNQTIENIKRAISESYNGRPDIGYTIFETTLNELRHRVILPKKEFQRFSLYRLRIDSTITHRKEIFHIPFSKRTLVAPQRYSIAGFPSLYLANSVYTAWEELHRPALETLSFAKFTSYTSLYFINLSRQDFKYRIDIATDLLSFFQELVLYPILMTCSIKVANPTHPFKPEYIFPQFVLRWCKSEDEYDGIMYDSTRIHPKSQGTFHNFVIPVADYRRNTDFCPDLTAKLKLTVPCAIDKIDMSKSVDYETIADVSEIFSKELHGIIPFNDSIFARIETHLQRQDSGTLL
jgi:hypothetical protein